MADGSVAAWNAKYTYNQVRPVTLANNGHGCASTSNLRPYNGRWVPLLPTPPFPGP
jgi:hypothetical protein